MHAIRRLAAMLLISATMIPLAAARPSGHPPATAAQRDTAWQQHRKMRDDSLFNGLKWRDIGPISQGGRVVGIASVPGKPYTFYVAYATGGIWKTSNNGASFKPLSDRMPTMAMGAIAVDPEHPATVWAGTGEANSSRSSYGGVGLFRSDDGGRHFRAAGLPDSDRIARIVVDPTDSNTVYVAALGKLYTTGGQRGVYRTRDGGKTWQQVLAGKTPWTGAIDLVMDPRDPHVLYAALWDRKRTPWEFTEAGSGSGVWKSSDGGEHWTQLTAGLPGGDKVGRIGLAIAASHPDTLYASIDNWAPLPKDQREAGDNPLSSERLKTMTKAQFLRQDPHDIESFIRANDLDTPLTAAKLIAMLKSGQISMGELRDKLVNANANLFDTDIKGLEVYRSDDAGAHWRKANTKPLREVVYTYGYYFGQIRVAPDDPEHVYAEGLPLIESTDGGKTWAGLNGPDVHVDYHELLIDPNFPQRIIVGNDGGLAMTYDRGRHWHKIGEQPVGQFYSVTYDMADPYNVYGGLQDNGSMKCPSGNRWRVDDACKSIGGGDGMYVQVDTRDNKTVYSGYQFGNYQRNGPDGEHEVRPRPPLKAAALRYNWETPIELSGFNQDILYFGANRLFRSMDQGETWTAISPDLSTSDKRGDVPYATLTTIGESPKRFGLIWAGTDDGNVWVTADGGVQWKHVDGNLRPRWVSRVEASHFDEQRAYVALNGYRDDDITPYLYRTDDLGQHWTSIADGLPAEAINVVREDPVNPDVLYVGTDRGVYVSTDRGRHWQSLQANLPNVPVHDLAVHPRERELIAATHGRSLWIVDVLPIQELTPKLRDQALKLFPVEDIKAKRNWSSRAPQWFDVTPYLPHMDGTYWTKQPGKATLAVIDADGNTVRTLSMDAKAGVNSYRWNLLADKQLALAAENARLKREHLDANTSNYARQPVHNAVRLGRPLYVQPGKYTLKLQLNGATSTQSFEVKAPEPRKPRAKPKPKLRGRGKWARPQPVAPATPVTEEMAHERGGG